MASEPPDPPGRLVIHTELPSATMPYGLVIFELVKLLTLPPVEISPTELTPARVLVGEPECAIAGRG